MISCKKNKIVIGRMMKEFVNECSEVLRSLLCQMMMHFPAAMGKRR